MQIRPPQHPLLQRHQLTCATLLAKLMIGVIKLSLSRSTVVVPIEAILRKCIHIPMKGKHYDYVVPLLNTYEVH